MDNETQARFFAKVDTNGPVIHAELGPCHVWTGCRLKDGYGRFKLGGKHGRSVLAHRVAWLIAHGRWPQPCALHKCDGGAHGCVRPDHLFEGSLLDNARDRDSKGRASPPERRCVAIRGARHPQTQLTDDDVREIRRRRAAGETCVSIAALFPTSAQTVSDIATRKVWRFLD